MTGLGGSCGRVLDSGVVFVFFLHCDRQRQAGPVRVLGRPRPYHYCIQTIPAATPNMCTQQV